MPKKPCAHPGCGRLVDIGDTYCDLHTVAERKDRERRGAAARAKKPWSNWYGRKAWKDRRARQLKAEPLCRMCPLDSRRIATVADHIVPHSGDYGMFWFGELQSLCQHCHSSRKQKIERRSIGKGGLRVQPSVKCDQRG